MKYNDQKIRNLDLGTYISLFNAAGLKNDFTGPELTSNWYKRNLLMYSLVQKITEEKDQKIMILLGSSHISLFKHFLDLDENFKSIELEEIILKK